jgi:hypothetical protein
VPRRRAPAPATTAATGPATVALYAETSAVLRVLLEGHSQLGPALTGAARVVTCDLTLLEADRALRRALRDGRLNAQAYRDGQHWLLHFAQACYVIALSGAILDRSKRDFPIEPVRTLDALHLAALKMWEETVGPIAVFSTDDRVRANAAAWGLTLVPA